MKLAAIPGITPVSTHSVESTERELTKLIIEARGAESVHDPGIAIAARDAAELAHGNGASLVAVVEHQYLEDAAGAEIREVTEARTERGYPVVIAERILVSNPPSGCQLQAVVLDSSGRRLAVFTLHSMTGRGWLELATLLGRLVSTVDFTL